MRRFYFLWIVFAALLLSCKTQWEAPAIKSVERFKITKISLEGVEGELELKIKNPNPISFTLFHSSAKASFSGINLGSVSMKEKVRIPARSDKTHTFYLQGKFKEMKLSDLTQLFSAKLGQLDIDGKIKVGKWFYRKKFDLQFHDRVSVFK